MELEVGGSKAEEGRGEGGRADDAPLIRRGVAAAAVGREVVGLVEQSLLKLVLGEGANSEVPGGDVVGGVGVGVRFGAAVANAGAGGVAAG